MKTLTYALLIFILFSCNGKTPKHEEVILKSYTVTFFKDKYSQQTNSFFQDDSIFIIKSKNDTTAYLNALTNFYNEKIEQRALFNYGQPKGFLIVDKDKIDISLKLSQRMVDGLQTQVRNIPKVKKMIQEYNNDSLGVSN
ncbi:hypothetical protein [Mucilaginibacter terrae]|uniref:Uncharacterized protein n=1 Tax=Mucilaginibacter terrae TaxID=1955052 RepID=A0ABU3GXZ0_9SPHI|nr:hypothetical protein [Mucilaginibacter terrae]MDT3404640.1 hypothetical protein [Mucilaginibacter terrae]